ncbi:MAG: S4 domain-containing protein [Candidatus Omnitrophica bacterium]|nr:S4 domain-containing protein [Candidatus Omnitrophota bacterium]
MRLDKFLFERRFVETRSKALHLIKTGNVRVNGKAVNKQSYTVDEGDRVEVTEGFRYVGRAGYKIEEVFRKLQFDVGGSNILDVGCSTGGFADFFLSRGAAKVTGVDIAGECVHEKILRNPAFVFHGGMDARDTKAMKAVLGEEKFDIISVDVSNMVLKDVLPGLNDFLNSGGLIAALFKPPYEAGEKISSAVRLAIVSKELTTALKKDYELAGKIYSPLRGGAGNRGTMEMFFVLRKKI